MTLSEQEREAWSRLGALSMVARLYILTGNKNERKELIRLLNQEFDPKFYEPIKED